MSFLLFQDSNQVTVNSIILLVIGVVLTAVIGWLFRTSSAKNLRMAELEKTVSELTTALAISDTKLTPMWLKVQKQLIEDLHHPHENAEEMDKLLDVLSAQDVDLTHDETIRMRELLRRRKNDMSVSEHERASATIMAVVMDKVLIESQAPEEELINVELVGEAPTPGK